MRRYTSLPLKTNNTIAASIADSLQIIKNHNANKKYPYVKELLTELRDFVRCVQLSASSLKKININLNIGDGCSI